MVVISPIGDHAPPLLAAITMILEKIGNILIYLLKRVISEKLANHKSALIEEAQKYILKNKF